MLQVLRCVVIKVATDIAYTRSAGHRLSKQDLLLFTWLASLRETKATE